MSRIGKAIIEIPPGVTLEEKNSVVSVVGPKGTLTLTLPTGFHIEKKENTILVTNKSTDLHLGNIHGLYRSLLNNIVIGVTKGWEKTVELVGVGYKATGGGNEVSLSVGFTHQVKFVAPKDITFKISDNTKLTISGIDKKIVGEIAAQIRATKPPEPYKGKGIRYLGEIVRKKAGKAIKAAGAA